MSSVVRCLLTSSTIVLSKIFGKLFLISWSSEQKFSATAGCCENPCLKSLPCCISWTSGDSSSCSRRLFSENIHCTNTGTDTLFTLTKEQPHWIKNCHIPHTDKRTAILFNLTQNYPHLLNWHKNSYTPYTDISNTPYTDTKITILVTMTQKQPSILHWLKNSQTPVLDTITAKVLSLMDEQKGGGKFHVC